MQKFLCKILLLTGVLFSMSCASADPLYMANQSKITDIDWPRHKIVGTWAAMDRAQVQLQEVDREGKVYYDLDSGGGGQVLQVDLLAGTNRKIEIQAPLKWRYLGKNHWEILLPSSDKYRVIGKSGSWQVGYRAPVSIGVRFFEGRLYVPESRDVWVRANAGEISAMARRKRSQPVLLRVIR